MPRTIPWIVVLGSAIALGQTAQPSFGVATVKAAAPVPVIGTVDARLLGIRPMVKLADLLSAQLKRPVVDKAGLAGNYDFTFEFAPETQAVPGNGIGQDIGAAVQQLGLRLVTMKGKIDQLVVDKMEKVPSEN